MVLEKNVKIDPKTVSSCRTEKMEDGAEDYNLSDSHKTLKGKGSKDIKISPEN